MEPVALVPTAAGRKELAWVFAFAAAFLSLPVVSAILSARRAAIPALRSPPSVNLSTSIAFYIILGSTQHVLKRGYPDNSWQLQLRYFSGNYSTHYVTDGPMNLDGLNIDPIIMPNGSTKFTNDRQLCIRTPGTWEHFVEHHADTRWYFRGTHDTYVNMSAMLLKIAELEKQGDPMTTPLMAYNFHEYNHVFYPQGGAGYLFSNYAVKKFYEDREYFKSVCAGLFDDVALAHFINDRIGWDLKKFQTPQVIVTFPFWQVDMIRKQKFDEVGKCPEYYYLVPNNPYGLRPCPIHKAITIHMHTIDVDEASEILEKVPDNFYVYFPDPNTPKLCYIKN